MLRISTQSHETTFPALAVGDVFKWLYNDDAALIKVDEQQALLVEKGRAPRPEPVNGILLAVYLGRVEWTACV